MNGEPGSAPRSAGRRGRTCPHSPRGSGAPVADPGEGLCPPPTPLASPGARGDDAAAGGGGGERLRLPSRNGTAGRPRRSSLTPSLPHHHPSRGAGSRRPPRDESAKLSDRGAEGNRRFPNFPRALTGGAHGAPHAPRRPPPRPLRHGPSEGRGEGAHCSPAPPPRSSRCRSTPRPPPHNAPRPAAE